MNHDFRLAYEKLVGYKLFILSRLLDYKHLMNVSRIARYMPDNYVPSDEELWG